MIRTSKVPHGGRQEMTVTKRGSVQVAGKVQNGREGDSVLLVHLHVHVFSLPP